MLLSVAAAAAAQPAAQSAAQGRIVALNGRVEHTPAAQEQWGAARVLQPLLTAERVRTLEASRAAILFIDETQVKLNAGAVLTIREVRRGGTGTGTSMDLSRGEAWFRTKNPRSGLTIQTPAAAAAVRGTEINVRLGSDGETVLTVVEGSAEFFNPQGTILVNAGEEGTARPGQAPTKRVILNPADAVQWALYYPTRRAPADPAGDPDVERRAEQASAALAAGNAVAARRELEALLAADPAALRPLVLLSSLELRQNNPEAARGLAARATTAHPRSVGALIAAAEAAQARFELDAAHGFLTRALGIDPSDVQALVNRARIRFGTDDTPGAKDDASRALAAAANDPDVRSLRGFINLADGEMAAARADFEAAVQADAELGEPHLGLGLIHFREGRVDDGLLEMLMATLLEPSVALYQSYLGKAYYQSRRFPEGLSALSSAKRLDPRDPTPWLYSSFYLRDQNQQVDALNELRQAIALNDYRAVYRSRLLLDRDLATKNVSLAEIYRQLGFEAWGAYEALNSLETDLTNSAAHLFLAETYGGLADRTQALGSELLQYFLYAPVNRNVFNNFAEYTALLEQPRQQLSVTGEVGSREHGFGNVNYRSGNERVATVAFLQARGRDSFRPDTDDTRVQGFFQSKVAVGRRSDLFFTFSGVRDEAGASEVDTVGFGLDVGVPIIIRQFTTPNPNETNHFKDNEVTLGFKHQWRPGSVLTTTARYDDLERSVDRVAAPTSLCTGFDVGQFGATANGTITNPFKTFDVQVQQTARIGRHQLIAGQQAFTLDKEDRCFETIRLGTESFQQGRTRSGTDSGAVTYVRDEVQLSPRLHASLAVDYQRATYRDLASDRRFDEDRVNPRLGISARVTPSTVLRAAAFTQLNINFLSDFIAPPTVAGFVIARNEFPTARREELNLAVEHNGRRGFVAARGFVRTTEVPFLLADEVTFIPEADATGVGGNVYVNWILNRRLTVFGENQLARLNATAFDRTDNLTRIGINVIHPRGVFLRVTGSHVFQRFTKTPIPGLPRSSFVLADADLQYEFAGKRGLVTLRVTNLFDRRFSTAIEALTIDAIIPDRRVLASLRWRLW